MNTGNIYATAVGSSSNPPSSGVSYSLYAPAGTNYFPFAVLDRANKGYMGLGAIANVNGNSSMPLSVTQATTANINLVTPIDHAAGSGAFVKSNVSESLSSTPAAPARTDSPSMTTSPHPTPGIPRGKTTESSNSAIPSIQPARSSPPPNSSALRRTTIMRRLRSSSNKHAATISTKASKGGGPKARRPFSTRSGRN